MAQNINLEMDFDSNNSSDYEDVLNSTVSDEVSGCSKRTNREPVMPEMFSQFQEYFERKLANLDKLNKIEYLEKMLCDNIKQHDSRLVKLETDNQRLKQQIDELSRSNEV